MAIGYVDVNRKKITQSEYAKLADRRDNGDSYGVFGEYEGDDFKIRASWGGAVKDRDASPAEYWTPYKVNYFNIYIADAKNGKEVRKTRLDPVKTKKFATVTEMMDYYRSEVLRLTDMDMTDVLETEFDEIVGFNGTAPKKHLEGESAELQELLKEDEDAVVGYDDAGGW